MRTTYTVYDSKYFDSDSEVKSIEQLEDLFQTLRQIDTGSNEEYVIDKKETDDEIQIVDPVFMPLFAARYTKVLIVIVKYNN